MLSAGLVSRATPLTPGAALGIGPVALALAARLLQQDNAQLGRLRGVGGLELLLVLGDADDLPWCDGIIYLAREPELPELFLPCALEPDVPAPLLLRALSQRFKDPSLRLPCAVVFEPPLAISIAAAQPLDRRLCAAWHERALGAGAES